VVLNRTWFRGVITAVGAAGVATACVLGPSIASAASSAPATAPAAVTARPIVVDTAGMVHRPRPKRVTPARVSRGWRRPALYDTPRDIAYSLAYRWGWSGQQWSCLDALWTRESGWDPYADNSSSGAYGVPQALPADKMAAFGSDWRTNPVTQIRWGLWYIATTYGTPCVALHHSDYYDYY
jgi:hypothetical protein